MSRNTEIDGSHEKLILSKDCSWQTAYKICILTTFTNTVLNLIGILHKLICTDIWKVILPFYCAFFWPFSRETFIETSALSSFQLQGLPFLKDDGSFFLVTRLLGNGCSRGYGMWGFSRISGDNYIDYFHLDLIYCLFSLIKLPVMCLSRCKSKFKNPFI